MGSRFPALDAKKSGTGHRLFRRKDVELVLEIKRLLYEQRFTIEGARKFLEERTKLPTVKAAAKKSRSQSGPKQQADLFSSDPAPIVEKVRKELRALADMLK